MLFWFPSQLYHNYRSGELSSLSMTCPEFAGLLLNVNNTIQLSMSENDKTQKPCKTTKEMPLWISYLVGCKWCGLVWFGMLANDMGLYYVMVWYGIVWYGMVQEMSDRLFGGLREAK